MTTRTFPETNRTYPETQRIEISRSGSGWNVRLDTGDGYGDLIPTPWTPRAEAEVVMDQLAALHPNADVYLRPGNVECRVTWIRSNIKRPTMGE